MGRNLNDPREWAHRHNGGIGGAALGYPGIKSSVSVEKFDTFKHSRGGSFNLHGFYIQWGWHRDNSSAGNPLHFHRGVNLPQKAADVMHAAI